MKYVHILYVILEWGVNINNKISLEEAQIILANNIETLGTEDIYIGEALNRVLAENITATINNPPFNKSPYDGYALNSKDTLEVNKEKAITLEVIEEIFAGQWPSKIITKGKAARIMTGAPIPEGANAVIMQEKVIRQGNFIKVNTEINENENICFTGEDIEKGNILVTKGKTIDYADLGIICSTGIDKVKVFRKPKIGIITTGDEIIEPGKELKPGKIYNSNGYLLKGRLKELGYVVEFLDHVGDSIEDIEERIKTSLEDVEFLITTGGVSVGDKDYLNHVMDNLGAKKLFWKIRIKPGSAVLCTIYKGKVILSLSGNPTAALTTFELIARNILFILEQKEELKLKKIDYIFNEVINKKSPVRRFVRGNIIKTSKGYKVSITQVKKGNGILSSLLNSNCLIDIKPDNKDGTKGEINVIEL